MSGLELIEPAIANILKKQGINDLLPVQREALQQGLLRGASLILLAPTSSGKTLTGEILAVHNALKRERTAILVPYKALAEERYADLCSRWSELGLRAVLSTGDHPSIELSVFQEGEVDVALFTYERFLSLITSNNNTSILSLFSALVVDELQLISDEERGPRLEWILTFLRGMKSPLQFLGLSAVTSDLNGLDKWLNAIPVVVDSRPVRLTELVALPNGSCKGILRSETGVTTYELIIPPYESGAKENRIVSFLKNEFQNSRDQQILVFRSTVNDAEHTAVRLARELTTLGPAEVALKRLADMDTTEVNVVLQECLRSSIAFHTSELTLEERAIVEEGFRSGEIKCIVATSTLAMGVNMPCTKVVIVELERWNKRAGKNIPYTVMEYRNMSGRAGRFGLRNEDGASYYLADDPMEAKYVLERYINGNPEPIESALTEHLDLMVIFCLAYMGSGNNADITDVLLDTFAGSQRWNEDFKRDALRKSIDNIVSGLSTSGLIELDTGRYRLTDLGLLCASSGMDIESFVALSNWIQKRERFSRVDFLALLSGLQEVVRCRFPGSSDDIRLSRGYVIKLLEEEEYQDEATGRLMNDLRRIRYDWNRAQQARRVAAILAYINGWGIGEIEQRIRVRYGTLRTLTEAFKRVCREGLLVAEYLGKTSEFTKGISKLLEGLEFGVPEKGRDLARLRVLARSQVLTLVNAGIDNPLSFLEAEPAEIAKLLFKSDGTRVEALKQEVIRALGPVLESYRSQAKRANERLISLIHQIYASRGTELECPVESLLAQLVPQLKVKRITPQRAGEADYSFTTRDGRPGIVQLASKDNPHKKVSLSKAGSVLSQSPELRPEVFICIGFPGFDETAISKADALGQNFNYKIICLPDLLEAALRVTAGDLPQEKIYDIFESERGFISAARLGIGAS